MKTLFFFFVVAVVLGIGTYAISFLQPKPEAETFDVTFEDGSQASSTQLAPPQSGSEAPTETPQQVESPTPAPTNTTPPAQQPAPSQPSPAPTPTPTPTLSPAPTPAPNILAESPSSIRSGITTTELILRKDSIVPIANGNATIVLTNIKDKGGVPTADLLVRESTGGAISVELPTNANQRLDLKGGASYVIEVRSISADEELATVTIKHFLSAKGIPPLPAITYGMPLQTLILLPNPRDKIHLMIEKLSGEKVQVQATTYKDGIFQRSFTDWYAIGTTIEVPAVNVVLSSIDRDGSAFYSSSLIEWGPHVIGFDISRK